MRFFSCDLSHFRFRWTLNCNFITLFLLFMNVRVSHTNCFGASSNEQAFCQCNNLFSKFVNCFFLLLFIWKDEPFLLANCEPKHHFPFQCSKCMRKETNRTAYSLVKNFNSRPARMHSTRRMLCEIKGTHENVSVGIVATKWKIQRIDAILTN